MLRLIINKLKTGTAADVLNVLAFRIGGIVFTYLTMYLVINWGDIKTWGWLNLVISLVNLLGVLTTFGLHTLVLKRFPISTNENNRVEIWKILKIVTLLSFILIICLLPFKEFFLFKIFKTDENISYRVFLAFLLLIPVFNLQKIVLSIFRINKQMIHFAIFNRTNVYYFFLSFISLVSILLYGTISTRTVLKMLIIISSAVLVLGFYLALKKLNAFKLEFFIDKWNKSLRYTHLLKESTPLVLSSSLMMILGWSDTFLIGIFMTPEDVGYYNIIFKISSIATIFLTVVNAVITPKLSVLYHQDKKKLGRFVRKSNKYIFLLTSAVLVIIIFFSETILSMFGSDTAFLKIPLLVLIVGYFINAYCGTIGFLLQMTGYAHIFQNIVLIATITNISLNLILIPKFGLLGAAIAGTISMSFWNIVGTYIVNRKLKINTIFFI